MEQHPSPRSAQRKRMDGERRSPSQWDEDDREARVHAAWCCHNSAQARARSRHHSRRSSSEITTRKITVLKLKCFCPHGASDLRAQNRGSTRHQHQRRLPQQPPLQHVISTKGGCRSSRRSKMGGEGFEPPKVKPADLQSALVGRLSIRPAVPAWGAGRRSYNALEAAANGFVSSCTV